MIQVSIVKHILKPELIGIEINNGVENTVSQNPTNAVAWNMSQYEHLNNVREIKGWDILIWSSIDYIQKLYDFKLF